MYITRVDGTCMPPAFHPFTPAVRGKADTPSPAPLVPTVEVVNGLCGSGKSTAAVNVIADGVLRGERFLIAGPSISQSEQFACDLRSHLESIRSRAGRRVVVVNGQTAEKLDRPGDPVQRLLADAIAGFTPTSGCAVCITHATLLMLPRSPKLAGWTLVIDEAPACVLPEEIRLPNATLKGLRFFDAPPPDQPLRLHADKNALATALAAVKATRERLDAAADALAHADAVAAADLRSKAHAVRRGEEESLLTLLRRVKTGHWLVVPRQGDLVPDGDVKGIGRYRLRLSSGDTTQVVLTSILDWATFLGGSKPQWGRVVLMAANFDHTYAALSMRMQGVHLVPEQAITVALRYRGAHPNGHLVTVLHATTRATFSKHLRDKVVDGRRVLDHVLDAIRERFAGQNFCWSANKDVPDDALHGDRMPFTAHGLNKFAHHTSVAVLNIALLNPQCMGALEELGFNADEVRCAVMVENVYQAVCRSAVRNTANTRPIMMIVPDVTCAEFVAARFPGCAVHPLGVEMPTPKALGRPQLHESDAARKAEVREMERARLAVSAEHLRERAQADVQGIPSYEVSYYGDKHDAEPCYTDIFDSFDALAAALREFSNEPPAASKQEGTLMLQARLRPMTLAVLGEKATTRGDANIASRSTLWLDIESLGDGASGPPIPLVDLRRVLPCIRIVAYSSYSHRDTPDGLRYRAVLPLSHAVGAYAYRVLYDLVLDAVEQARWMRWKFGDTRRGRFHGIDVSKRPPCSMFYVPQRAAGHEAEAWFEDLPGAPLDVQAWLARDVTRIVPSEERIAPPRADGTSLAVWDLAPLQQRADEFCKAYLALGRGVQGFELNRLAWQLAALGLPRNEIEAHVAECARQSHSPADRAAQVGRIMRHLAKAGP